MSDSNNDETESGEEDEEEEEEQTSTTAVRRRSNRKSKIAQQSSRSTTTPKNSQKKPKVKKQKSEEIVTTKLKKQRKANTSVNNSNGKRTKRTKNVEQIIQNNEISRHNHSRNNNSKSKSSHRSKSSFHDESQENDLDEEDDDENQELDADDFEGYPTVKKCIHDVFHNYEIGECDFIFQANLFNMLPDMRDLWDRIGFDEANQADRMQTFYNQLSETAEGILDSEQELEENILKTINKRRSQIKDLCIELSLKCDDLVGLYTPASSRSMKAKHGGQAKQLQKHNSIDQLPLIEQDAILLKEVDRLADQKEERMVEVRRLLKAERLLCERVVEPCTELGSILPSQHELDKLAERITNLEQCEQARHEQMCSLRHDIFRFADDLEVSRMESSFAEEMLCGGGDSTNVMRLGEDDLKKAIELRDDLARKDAAYLNEIRSLRTKILELWSKLEIENLNLKSILQETEPQAMCSQAECSKRTLVVELRKEFEHCVQVKQENMQKFIEKTRVELRAFCGKLFFGAHEMAALDVELFQHTDYNDDLLTKHESKLDDLKFQYDETRELYEKTRQWLDTWSAYCDFVETTKDPTRLTKRGYKMLDEEKKRKHFEKALPKLEHELQSLANDYPQGGTFCVYGSPYAQFIAHRKQEHEESKKREKQEKQIMRDNLKVNESRFGAKPVTPLALRKKRPAVHGHDQSTVAQITNANNATAAGKKKKLFDTTAMSQGMNSPGANSTMVHNGAAKLPPGSKGGSSNLSRMAMRNNQVKTVSKSSAASAGSPLAGTTGTKRLGKSTKRKTITPAKSRAMRKSRQLNAVAVAKQMAQAEEAKKALKLAAAAQAAELASHQSSSNISSTTSTNASTCSFNYSANVSSKMQYNQKSTTSKFPPPALSSKYSRSKLLQPQSSAGTSTTSFSSHHHQSVNISTNSSGFLGHPSVSKLQMQSQQNMQLQLPTTPGGSTFPHHPKMSSTASNTFIDEENFEELEKECENNNSENENTVLSNNTNTNNNNKGKQQQQPTATTSTAVFPKKQTSNLANMAAKLNTLQQQTSTSTTTIATSKTAFEFKCKVTDENGKDLETAAGGETVPKFGSEITNTPRRSSRKAYTATPTH